MPAGAATTDTTSLSTIRIEAQPDNRPAARINPVNRTRMAISLGVNYTEIT
jgi:hypothetical protein